MRLSLKHPSIHLRFYSFSMHDSFVISVCCASPTKLGLICTRTVRGLATDLCSVGRCGLCLFPHRRNLRNSFESIWGKIHFLKNVCIPTKDGRRRPTAQRDQQEPGPQSFSFDSLPLNFLEYFCNPKSRFRPFVLFRSPLTFQF